MTVYQAVVELPPEEAVRKISSSYLQIFADNPRAARLFQSDFAPPQRQGAVRREESRFIEVIRTEANAIRRDIALGLFRKMSAEDVALARIGLTVTHSPQSGCRRSLSLRRSALKTPIRSVPL